MIKYFVNEEKRQVIGVLEDTRWDAHNKISKMIIDTDFCLAMSKKYMMPSKFKVVVKCDPSDEFSAEEGMRIAKKRILDRYYAALDKRVAKFLDAVLLLNGKVFETSADVEENT